MTEKSYVQNAADEDQVKGAKGRLARARERETSDLMAVLSTREGRRHYWRLMSRCGVFGLSFTRSSRQTAFNEGERNIGLLLFSELTEHAPDNYALMISENKEDEKKQ